MEKACMAWEACMKKDPSITGRAKLHAETFAEVINSLVDPISYKTMVCYCHKSKQFISSVDVYFVGCIWNDVPFKLRL